MVELRENAGGGHTVESQDRGEEAGRQEGTCGRRKEDAIGLSEEEDGGGDDNLCDGVRVGGEKPKGRAVRV